MIVPNRPATSRWGTAQLAVAVVFAVGLAICLVDGYRGEMRLALEPSASVVFTVSALGYLGLAAGLHAGWGWSLRRAPERAPRGGMIFVFAHLSAGLAGLVPLSVGPGSGTLTTGRAVWVAALVVAAVLGLCVSAATAWWGGIREDPTRPRQPSRVRFVSLFAFCAVAAMLLISMVVLESEDRRPHSGGTPGPANSSKTADTIYT